MLMINIIQLVYVIRDGLNFLFFFQFYYLRRIFFFIGLIFIKVFIPAYLTGSVASTSFSIHLLT